MDVDASDIIKTIKQKIQDKGSVSPEIIIFKILL
jgi:hypothetical protein